MASYCLDTGVLTPSAPPEPIFACPERQRPAYADESPSMREVSNCIERLQAHLCDRAADERDLATSPAFSREHQSAVGDRDASSIFGVLA